MADTVSRWLIGFGAAGLLAMTAIVGWQVFGRFILDASPSWTEQASLILMIWYVMFSSAARVPPRALSRSAAGSFSGNGGSGSDPGCFHGGVFFQAIGEKFDRLDHRQGIINADGAINYVDNPETALEGIDGQAPATDAPVLDEAGKPIEM